LIKEFRQNIANLDSELNRDIVFIKELDYVIQDIIGVYICLKKIGKKRRRLGLIYFSCNVTWNLMTYYKKKKKNKVIRQDQIKLR
jgi:hypothetical protein